MLADGFDSHIINHCTPTRNVFSIAKFITEPRMHTIFAIPLHFTQKVVGEPHFLLHQNCLRKFIKIRDLSRGLAPS